MTLFRVHVSLDETHSFLSAISADYVTFYRLSMDIYPHLEITRRYKRPSWIEGKPLALLNQQGKTTVMIIRSTQGLSMINTSFDVQSPSLAGKAETRLENCIAQDIPHTNGM